MGRKFPILAVVAFGALAWVSTANATQILAFGQTSQSNTINAAVNGSLTQTTITGTDVAISITQIQGASPASAYLDLTATSTGSASTVGGDIIQTYSGSFSITSGLGDTGTNYLSGTFTDAIFGSGTGLTLTASDPSETISFTSDVITDLSDPTAISLSFTNVTPPVFIDGTTLGPFSSSITGTFSGSATPVPEPASLSLFGAALIGFGLIRRRGKSA